MERGDWRGRGTAGLTGGTPPTRGAGTEGLGEVLERAWDSGCEGKGPREDLGHQVCWGTHTLPPRGVVTASVRETRRRASERASGRRRGKQVWVGVAARGESGLRAAHGEGRRAARRVCSQPVSPKVVCEMRGSRIPGVMLPQSRDYVMNPLLSRTQGLEGLAEAQRSWQEGATDRPTSLLAGPLASDVFSQSLAWIP